MRCIRPVRRAFSSVPSHADAVVVGGGSIGASTFMHLAERGLNVVLIEKDDLTAGTTWHSAGLLWRLRPNDTDIELLNRMRNLVITDGPLHKETGMDVWTANGGIFCANNIERLNEYRRLQGIGQTFGIESHLLTPAECTDIYPLMGTDDIVGALYSPGDGLVDPSGWTQAAVKMGKNRGGQAFTHTKVKNILTENNKVTGVETDKGLIRTNNVINCAGSWSEKIGNMAGLDVPLMTMRHAYVVTEPIPDLGFVPNIRDHDLSVYMKLQGQALAIGGYEPNPIPWEVEEDFSFGLFDLDWDVFGFNLEGHMTRVPCLENIGIAHTVCGPESFTPDHKPLMGPSVDLQGFWFNCGFNSSGIMLSGGCGEQLATWLVDGSPELDMFGYDVNRFHKTYAGDKKWRNDRSQEAYAKNYAIVFPHDQPLAGRNMRHTPFHERLVADGCVHQEVLGWERPLYFMGPDGESTSPKKYDYYGAYEGIDQHDSHRYFELLKHEYTFEWPSTLDVIKKQHDATRNAVAAFDMSAFGKIELTGPDAQKAMDWICTNRVDQGAGKVTYTEMLNERGGIESDLTVTCTGDNEFYIVTPGASFQHDWWWIEESCRRKGFNVEMKDITDSLGVLSVQGPKSRDLLAEITDMDLSDESFPFGVYRETKVGGVDVKMLRLTFVGELGWEIHIPRDACLQVYDKVFEVGSKYGLVNAGYSAIESLSLEKGYKHWHQDVSVRDTPLEAGLAFACKLKSDIDFNGRAALEMQKKQGLKKRLVYIYPEEDVAIFGLETLYRDGEPCGYLRRAGFCFSLHQPVGTGYVTDPAGGKVNLDFIRSGSYELDVMGKRVSCRVDTKTPFDPKNLRVKGIYETQGETTVEKSKLKA